MGFIHLCVSYLIWLWLVGVLVMAAVMFLGLADPGQALYAVAAAAIVVGIAEAFASFFASQFKEVIVFTLILPVLLVRSLTSGHHEEEH